VAVVNFLKRKELRVKTHAVILKRQGTSEEMPLATSVAAAWRPQPALPQ